MKDLTPQQVIFHQLEILHQLDVLCPWAFFTLPFRKGNLLACFQGVETDTLEAR